MNLFTRHWFVACIALLLLGAYAPQLSGQQRNAVCAEQCQQADADTHPEQGRPGGHTPTDDCGQGCGQCVICHSFSAHLLPDLTLPKAKWTLTMTEFMEWKDAFYNVPSTEIDYPPQFS